MDNRYYVYCLLNKDWGVPFYIGKGTGDRYKDVEHRNTQIKSIMKRCETESKILISDLSEPDALVLEKWLKVGFKECGYPIIDNEKEGRAATQRAGIERAKLEGKYKGRTPVTPADFAAQYARYQRREIPSKAELARVLKISRPTLDKLIKEQEASA